MKQKIQTLVLQAARRAYERGALASDQLPEVEIEEPKIASHGDFSTNMAMVMAAGQKMAPRKIAAALIGHLEDSEGLLAKTEIAGPGFINFFIPPAAWQPVLKAVHSADTRFGASRRGRDRKVQVEFVSANPTGPLHVGHGRGAAVGDTVARILAFCGYDVQKEYYINDSGRQINTLGRSVFLRYRELYAGDPPEAFPEDCYQGAYVRDLARELHDAGRTDLLQCEPDEAVATCARFAADRILSGIREDLEAFGVGFDRWFSEQSLYDSGKVAQAIAAFRESGLIYPKDGALWFKTTDYGDEKDRVVVRNNGLTTYFASDISYHEDKYRRGFERVIDVWGADHHGYVPRMTAAIEASGRRRGQFHVILVQLVNLLRAGQPVAMSTRAGEFVTLRETLAAAFHAYYNRHRVLSEDPALTQARLYLVLAVQKVIRNGLNLLGVSAPASM